MNITLFICAILIIMLLLILLKNIIKNNNNYENFIKNLEDNIRIKQELKQELNDNFQQQSQIMINYQKSQSEIILNIQKNQQDFNKEVTSFLNQQMRDVLSFQQNSSEKNADFQMMQFEKIMNNNSDSQEKLVKILQDNLAIIQKTNEEKLDKIQGIVSEKLDKTLNERLDSNFKQIGDQLGDLYKSLGELNKLSSGVTDLNKTLSNVKSRGTWGEIQLKGILEQTMVSSQYDTNVITKKNSNDRVEFAIKIPSKDNNSSFLYLPIDSKMPSDIYNKIVDASNEGDVQKVNTACKELEQRIKTESRTIRDKYIDPPNTTDFAIMFLPTEGLYAEVLRIDGLAEWCQINCKIIISGPTTITALLNSLRLGFSNMALTKKSQEVLKLLQAIKTQYSTFGELIDKTQKKLHEAISSTDNLKNRTEIIQRRMSKIEELDSQDANNILGIDVDTSE